MAQILTAARPKPGLVLAKAVLAAADRLALRQSHLAVVLGSSEASISRLQNGRALSPVSKEGELALMFIRLFRSLDSIMGGADDKSRLWLHAYNTHLAGIPAEQIQRVEGLVDVVQYLDAMRGRL